MAGTQVVHQIPRPNATVCRSFRRRSTAVSKSLAFPPFKDFALAHQSLKTKYSKLAVRSAILVDQYYCPPADESTVVDMQRLVDFLYEDLPHVFDDQGIDQTAYDECMKFRDPITKHESLSGYLFNITFLKILFRPRLQLHWVKQTGPHEISARWTVVMEYVLLPWKPQLVLTGTSIMGINPETGKFCTHVDVWDSIRENNYFSLEAFLDIFKQMWICWIYRTPEVGTPKYQILKRMPNYEVRKYGPLVVIEGTDSTDHTNQEVVNLMRIKGGTAAVMKFIGKPTADIVREKDKTLRSYLIADGIKPEIGCFVARHSDQERIWSFSSSNELLIWLEEFTMD